MPANSADGYLPGIPAFALMGVRQDLVKCPYCGMEAPAENLLCIYCGRSLNLRMGFGVGVWFILIACGLIAAFIAWLL